jgi:hypothetical protein
MVVSLTGPPSHPPPQIPTLPLRPIFFSPVRLPPPPKLPHTVPSSPPLLVVRSWPSRAPRHHEIKVECHRRLHLPGEHCPDHLLPPIHAPHLPPPPCRSHAAGAPHEHSRPPEPTRRRRTPSPLPSPSCRPRGESLSCHRARRLPRALPVLTD